MNDWDDVRFFLELARSGSLTGAAKTLGVNHSTVSRRINSLEYRHGVTLFERVPSGYKLTEDGDEILETATEIEQLNHSFSRLLEGRDSRMEGRVVVTMPHDIFEFIVADGINDFRQQYPGISLDLKVAKGIKNLNAREADIAIRLCAQPPEYLVGKRVSSLTHGLFVAKTVSLEQSPSIIVWSGEYGIPDWAAEHFPNAQIAMQVDDLFSMYRAVEAGAGIARMPVYIHNTVKSNSVIRIPIRLEMSSWGVWVLSHVDLRRTARVQICRRFLLSILQNNQELFTDFHGEQTQE